MAEDRDRWRALVNGVMNLLVPQNGGNFWTGRGSLSLVSQCRYIYIYMYRH